MLYIYSSPVRPRQNPGRIANSLYKGTLVCGCTPIFGFSSFPERRRRRRSSRVNVATTLFTGVEHLDPHSAAPDSPLALHKSTPAFSVNAIQRAAAPRRVAPISYAFRTPLPNSPEKCPRCISPCQVRSCTFATFWKFKNM